MAIITALVLSTIVFASCGNSSLQAEVDILKRQIEELQAQTKGDVGDKGAVGDKGETGDKGSVCDKGETGDKGSDGDASKLNVFWTDKQEYSEDETITVYYGNNAIYSIRIDRIELYSNNEAIIVRVMMTSYLVDFYTSTIMQSVYLQWDNEILLNSMTYGSHISKVNEPDTVSVLLRDATEAIENATFFDLILCVPGTPFPITMIKNITIPTT